LRDEQLKRLQKIVAINWFDYDAVTTEDPMVNEVLKYYQVQRDSK
jgi:hypothetical protein